MFPDSMLKVLLLVAIGGPAGNGLIGLYQSCCILTVGLEQVPLNVTALVVLQSIACEVGLTVVDGATVFMTTAKVVVVAVQPDPLAATVYVPVLVNEPEVPFCGGPDKLVHV